MFGWLVQTGFPEPVRSSSLLLRLAHLYGHGDCFMAVSATAREVATRTGRVVDGSETDGLVPLLACIDRCRRALQQASPGSAPSPKIEETLRQALAEALDRRADH